MRFPSKASVGWRGVSAFAMVFAMAPQPASAAESTPVPARFLSQPSLRGDLIAFVYQGEVWTSDSEGKGARQRTFDGSPKSDPILSPDGRSLAFTAFLHGNRDVFVLSLTEGTPRRLTFHPADDHVQSWSSDGKTLLITSSRQHPAGEPELFLIPAGGGGATAIPIGKAHQAAFGPGQMIALTRTQDPPISWKGYRGGQAPAIKVVSLDDYQEAEVPHTPASDTSPVWLDDMLYFRSDREGPFGIYRYDPRTRAVQTVMARNDRDVESLAGDGQALVYSSDGYLFRFDLSRGVETKLAVLVPPAITSRLERRDLSGSIQHMALAPDGQTLAIEARGEIFVKRPGMAAADITRTSGSAERSPLWSPDGSRLAFVTDAGGVNAIAVQAMDARARPMRIATGSAGYPFGLAWSPDGHRIAFIRRDFSLGIADVATGRIQTIDAQLLTATSIEWAPDSSGVFYIERLPSGYGQARFATLGGGDPLPITDSGAHVREVRVSPDGRDLYVLASIEAGPAVSSYDISPALFYQSSMGQLYKIALRDGAASDEPMPNGFRIDPNGISKRIVPVPQSRGRYAFSPWDLPPLGRMILPTRDGAVAVLRRSGDPTNLAGEPSASAPPHWTLDLHDASNRAQPLRIDDTGSAKPAPSLAAVLDGASLQPSASPQRYLLALKGQPLVMTLDGEVARLQSLDVGPLNADLAPDLEMRQMFDEVARAFDDYFLDARMHGVDWPARTAFYRGWLKDARSRGDLAYVIAKLLGELNNSHLIFSDPTLEGWQDSEDVGLLGADIDSVDGRYIVRRILEGSPWDDDRSPLAAVGVRPGDQLRAVEGVPLRASEDLFERLRGRAGQPTRLTVASAGGGERTIEVRPLASEEALRRRSWAEANRRLVEARSNGTIAYLRQPDTSNAGLTEFVRGFFGQADRRALIIDERFNGGGADPDYQLDVIGRTPFIRYKVRELRAFAGPGSMVDGPKVMIVNAEAGSGGDVYPVQFKARGLGKVVGTRTWGGVNGYFRLAFDPASIPNRLIDGTEFVVPDLLTSAPSGNMVLENRGFEPDETVDISAADYARGVDTQLLRAIEILMSELSSRQ